MVTDKPASYHECVKSGRGLTIRHFAEKILLFKLFMYAFLFWVASEYAYIAFDVPSRRLCNISWFCFQFWILSSVLFGMYLFDRFTIDHSNPNMVINAVTFNQLMIFAASNLLCGLTNISI